MTKQKKVVAAVLLLSIWLFNGCAAVIVGAGVGAGAYTYIKGDLKRSYEVKFDKALKVCIGILEDLNQPIIERTTDGEKTTIKTKRKDGSPQTIQVAIESIEWTLLASGLWLLDPGERLPLIFDTRCWMLDTR
jgi:hypothetical protein